jgi:regulator of protease activity HflC (stomatin/prohibitin superfamily)
MIGVNKKSYGILWGLALVVVGIMVMRLFVIDWTLIEPGYVGIKIDRLVSRGISKEKMVTGFVFYNPVQTKIVSYPTFVQRVVWTHDLNEGSPLNEELAFNTKDSVPVKMDVAVSYELAVDQVPTFYTKFRADRITQFTHGYLHDTARNVVVDVGSEYSFDEINGAKKEVFLAAVTRKLDTTLSSIGVSIKQFGLVGAMRPPRALQEAVNAKTKAIQDAIRAENEVRQAKAEARKKVAIAEGEAAANRTLSSSLDERLLSWQRIQLQRAYIAKWDGHMPGVVSGNNGMLLNMPVPGK